MAEPLKYYLEYLQNQHMNGGIVTAFGLIFAWFILGRLVDLLLELMWMVWVGISLSAICYIPSKWIYKHTNRIKVKDLISRKMSTNHIMMESESDDELSFTLSITDLQPSKPPPISDAVTSSSCAYCTGITNSKLIDKKNDLDVPNKINIPINCNTNNIDSTMKCNESNSNGISIMAPSTKGVNNCVNCMGLNYNKFTEHIMYDNKVTNKTNSISKNLNIGDHNTTWSQVNKNKPTSPK